MLAVGRERAKAAAASGARAGLRGAASPTVTKALSQKARQGRGSPLLWGPGVLVASAVGAFLAVNHLPLGGRSVRVAALDGAQVGFLRAASSVAAVSRKVHRGLRSSLLWGPSLAVACAIGAYLGVSHLLAGRPSARVKGLNVAEVELPQAPSAAVTKALSQRARQGRGSSLRWGPGLVVAWAIGAFLAVNYVLPGRLSPDAELYIAQPAIWGFLALLSLILVLTVRDKPRVTQSILALAALAAAFQVAWLMGAGTAFGFGYSPYARQPLHMAQNGIYVGTLLLGTEMSRAYLISVFGPRRPFLSLSLISLFYALLLIPVGTYDLFGSTEGTFEAVGTAFLPRFAVSILATYLAASDGPLPAILYRGGIEVFYWFSPILPNLEWTTEAFLGTLGPVIALLVIRGFKAEEIDAETAPGGKDISAAWIVPAVLIVALLWFNTGMLGVQPAVISGVSMEPTMKAGDLALTRPVDPASLEVGDIVRFDKNGLSVMHRIVEIEDTSQGRVLVTHGDNNNKSDDPILAGQVEGKVLLVIPKLGWVPIKFGELLNQLRATAR